ncbi:MAG: ABC transporter ATP-binding protein [Gammaproteobacteria bacterium]|nr:MAG: ABC transporter ATP-binding protein [Gammaproteobacteria bacterium]
MIRIDGVSKCYGDTVALDGLSLDIDAGGTTVLIGPSGCGKSTLLRCLLGLVQAERGEICFGGRRLQDHDLLTLRRRIGYVVQQGGLFPHLDARSNVTLVAAWLGWSSERIAARLDELLALTRLPAAAMVRFPAELSGGQQQRVSLMRALMLDPDYLLLDEPLGALDPMIRHDLQIELRDIFGRLGKTVVLVTHDLHEAAWLADRIVLMRAGRVVQQGRLDELIRAPAEPFVEAFIRAQRSPLDSLAEPH